MTHSRILMVSLVCALGSALTFGEVPAAGINKILTGRSGLVDKTMNPAISINGLFQGNYGSGFEDAERGLRVQEMEAIFTAAVDPYFMGNFVITSENLEHLGIEEAYATTLSIPHVTVKFGKFLVNFGKNNWVHTHAQPLIDKPLVNTALLGEEGFNSVGAEASFLAPTPWYLDLTVGALRSNGADTFNSPKGENSVVTTRVDNLFDLSDTTTLGLGGSFMTGENESGNNAKNSFLGVDLTMKYISPRGRGNFAIAWINEFINGKRNDLGPDADGNPVWDKAWGAYSTVLVRLDQQFWVGGRFDYLNMTTAGVEAKTKGENLILAYVPSEFSTIRLQGGLNQTDSGTNTWKAMLQYNMTIGSHPAHAY